jgi:alkylation response protein AidB-like acyl-CoA dehydrogenase
LPSANQTALLAEVRAQIAKIQAEAGRLDAQISFPRQAFEDLIPLGLLTATLPIELGGMDFGTNTQGATALLELFILLGEASLAVARLYEAHVNALQLVCRYGGAGLVKRTAQDAKAGCLFALWVTDPPNAYVALKPTPTGFVLEGAKSFCSGAGVATRALITAGADENRQMLIISMPPNARVLPSPIKLAGMRAAITGSVDLSGMAVTTEDFLGAENEYLREPVFSAGAWRGSAAALGGLAALVKLHRNEIMIRKRDADPYQRMRFGKLVIAFETARLWMRQAALRACLEDDSDDGIVAYVNLARIAVESACLDAMQLTQRSLGLGAFIAGSRAELVCRDLATYLRQPAPDETLDKAAGHYFHAELPGSA